MDDDALSEKIKEYREMLENERPELDMELLMRVLEMVNDESEVKVAIDPVDATGEWVATATTYAVLGLRKLDDGRLALRVADERHGIVGEKLIMQLRKEFDTNFAGHKVPVLFVHKGEVVQLTEIYSHVLVRAAYAGMPSDVVLATAIQNDAR